MAPARARRQRHRAVDQPLVHPRTTGCRYPVRAGPRGHAGGRPRWYTQPGRPGLAGPAGAHAADNGPAGVYESRVEMDIEGNTAALIDARGLTVHTVVTDLMGRKLRMENVARGHRR